MFKPGMMILISIVLVSWVTAQDSFSILKITSEPEGAQIYLDEILSGSTPNILNRIPVGNHTLKITRDGYEDWITNLNIEFIDTNSVHAILNPLRGQIQFSSDILNTYIYIDGKLVGQTPKLVREIEYGWHYIEIRRTKKENDNTDYSAFLDTIAVYDPNVILINAKLKKEIDIKNLNPVAVYFFNSNAEDQSSNGNNGTVYGATLTEDRLGNLNSAFSFDGEDDYIIIPHSESLNLGKFGQSYSISIWVKSKNPQGKRLFQKWNEHLITPYPISIQTNSELCVANVYDGKTKSTMSKIRFGSIWDNNWHHLVITVNAINNIISGFLDGNLKQQENYLISISTSNNNDIYVGKSSLHGYFFKGDIDNISIYDRTLTEEEILALYNDSN